MQSKLGKTAIAIVAAILCFCVDASAQFKKDAFSQSYNDDAPTPKDSTEKIFNVKEYLGALAHKNTTSVQTLFEGSLVVPGGMQIYNKDYWKLPLVYGSLAAGIGGGYYFKSNGNTELSTACFIGAGLAYWATMMDGVVSYEPKTYPNAGKATLYSLLLPGLGQIYNHELWKLPIYVGGLGVAYHFYTQHKLNYERFQRLLLEGDTTLPQSTAIYYKDIYRRYRDYSVLAIAVVYLLQVIDANVFAYMHNFEVNDDMAISAQPAIILPPSCDLAFGGPSSPSGAALGLSIGFRF